MVQDKGHTACSLIQTHHTAAPFQMVERFTRIIIYLQMFCVGVLHHDMKMLLNLTEEYIVLEMNLEIESKL